ncbi:RluA family pseudouridine synthase [Candidatus Deianiraea vastatrix]|uniref:Pseudouridine synthase n=1 Tax=Candidatus Deianiraea vastatrix TaxID=2163644 RepID=A0A5B8XJX8_9RICK|nr:RluA family pseudouridine synthase [Candidatus Deianiraea vastatrix]QED23817.1 Ribosomal large subunit pseudouridine synthase D [Candidatus Deianiraea vastatrix]
MEFKISDLNDVLTRLDVFLTSKFSFSRTQIRAKIENGLAKVNDKVEKPSYKLENGDIVTILDDFLLSDKQDFSKIKQYDIKLDIVFEDEHLAVINKPAGLTTHPGGGNVDKTLVNALVSHFSKEKLSDIAGLDRLGIVHRLDKDTSGLLVIAKNNDAHRILSEDLKEKETFFRKYLAICYGVPVPTSGTIEKFMKKGSFADGKMIICNENDSNARYSNTYYEVEKTFLNGAFSLVSCELSTGRTHQIRLHLSSMKHSILGDKMYENCKKFKLEDGIMSKIENMNRHALHAQTLSFLHPKTRKKLVFKADLPEDLKEILKTIDK